MFQKICSKVSKFTINSDCNDHLNYFSKLKFTVLKFAAFRHTVLSRPIKSIPHYLVNYTLYCSHRIYFTVCCHRLNIHLAPIAEEFD